MRRSLLSLALAALCGVAASTVIAEANPAQSSEAAPLAIKARSTDAAPVSRIEGDEAMDDAVATAVIAAVSEQFDEHDVSVRLDSVAVRPASLRDRTVTGQGRVQFGSEDAWLPFRFEAQYDTVATVVSQPRLVLGDHDGGREMAIDSKLGRSLASRARDALHSEFAQQRVELVIDRLVQHSAGERYMHVEAAATADFGAEGSTPARINGLYDERAGRWLRVSYELGATANWADPSSQVVAAR